MIVVHAKILKKVNKKALFIAFLLLSFYIILKHFYVSFICADYQYLGYRYNPDSFRNYLSFFLIIIFLGLSLIVYRNGEFYYSIYILLLLLFFIPASTLYSFMRLPHKWYFLYLTLLIIFFIFSFIKIKLKEIQLKKSQEAIILFFILIIFGLPFFMNIGNYHINFNVLIFKDIYQTRSNFSSNSSTIINYSYFWIIKIIAPILFVYGLINRKYLFSVIAFCILTFIYLVSGHRTVYFALLILMIFYKLKDTLTDKTLLLLIGIILSSIIIVPFLDLLFSTRIFKFMLFERIFFDQSLLSYYYYDFFVHKPIYFSESMVFNKFFTYPYDLPSANLIGWEYLHSKAQHANTGLIGDAFMNAGFIGVVIISTLFSMIISFFNSLDIDARYFGIFIMYMFDFQNSNFLSILFSGGLCFLLVYAITIMKKRQNYEI